MAHQHVMGPIDPIQVPVPLTSSAPTNTIQVGDLVARNGSYVAIPAPSWPWTTDEATTQTAFAAAFLGLSNDRSLAGVVDLEGRNVSIQVATDGYVDFDCVSGTYHIGDYLGCDSASSLLKQTVKVVSTKAKAIAVVIVEPATNGSVTRIRARLINTLPKR